MDSLSCLPQEIINEILKLVPFKHLLEKCSDEEGYFFPTIDKFIKEVYLTEEAMFKHEYLHQLDFLLRRTIYNHAIEDIIDKIALKYARDYMKFVDDHGGIINSKKYIEETPISLIKFRVKTTLYEGYDQVKIVQDDIINKSDGRWYYFTGSYGFTNGRGGIINSKKYIEETPISLFSVKTTIYEDYDQVKIVQDDIINKSRGRYDFTDGPYSQMSKEIADAISRLLRSNILHRGCPFATYPYVFHRLHYKSIEIIKVFYPHGFICAKNVKTVDEELELIDKNYPHEETVLMKYL